jgi:hypothetical protein
MKFSVNDKSTYFILTKDNLDEKTYKTHFKEILENKDENITKYLCTIFCSYDISVKMFNKKFNSHISKYCPLFKYQPINCDNDDHFEFVDAGTIYSFFDYYKDSTTYRKNEYPAYSLHYILKNYVEDILHINVDWEIIKSPCTKNKFVIKVFGKDEEYEYLRNKDNINEFEDDAEGYKDAALRIFLFYNKYI